MHSKSLFLLFLLSTGLVIFSCLFVYATPLNEERLEVLRLSKIQKVFMKDYLRKRDDDLYIYSFAKAKREIDRLLLKSPITFVEQKLFLEENSSLSTSPNPNRVTLAGITDVLNSLDEKVALMITTHTDKTGSQQENLKLSQVRADVLKLYIKKRSNLAFISSIGYGAELPLYADDKNITNRRIEIDLKRIEQ